MDVRLKKIVDEAKLKYGLENYRLGTYEIYKERDAQGHAFYNFTMEWYPLNIVELDEEEDEDLNPDGTAIIEYNIQKERFSSVMFVQGQSFSTVIQFPHKTAEGVTAWLEQEWGEDFSSKFKLVEARTNSCRYERLSPEGIRFSPPVMIEVEYDDDGKLLNYSVFGLNELDAAVKKSAFTMALEEIEPLVKSQLKLVHLASEVENRFKPYYVMEEIFIAVEDGCVYPYSVEERKQVPINEPIEWKEMSQVERNDEALEVIVTANADDAFGHVDVDTALICTAEQIEQCKVIVRDLFSVAYFAENGLWQMEHLQYTNENFIEVHCRKGEEGAVFKRKAVVFIDPKTMVIKNLIDNEALFEIIDTFDPAEEAVVTHEDAFEELISYIGLDPTYLYDFETNQYILCGLLDAEEAVDAVTGEIVSLSEI